MVLPIHHSEPQRPTPERHQASRPGPSLLPCPAELHLEEKTVWQRRQVRLEGDLAGELVG